MAQNGTSLQQKQEWMRERHSPAVSPLAQPATTFAERHYSVAEIASMWNLAPDTVRRMFEREPGVLVLGDTNGGKAKRRYTTLRISESVVLRVYRRRLILGA